MISTFFSRLWEKPLSIPERERLSEIFGNGFVVKPIALSDTTTSFQIITRISGGSPKIGAVEELTPANEESSILKDRKLILVFVHTNLPIWLAGRCYFIQGYSGESCSGHVVVILSGQHR